MALRLLLVQIARIACTRSSMTAQRVGGSMPWFAISSGIHPTPTPNSTRPFDRTSRLASALAVAIGSRWGTRSTPVPIRSVCVEAAA